MSSFLEYCLQSYLLDSETLLIVKFSISSSDMQSMSRIEFHKQIEMKRSGIESEISKLLTIDFDIIEELKPIQTKDGALFTIHIASDGLKPHQVWQVLQSSVNDGYLPKALKNIYKLQKLPTISNIETKEIVAAWEQRSGRKSIANFVIHSSNQVSRPIAHHTYNSSSFNQQQQQVVSSPSSDMWSNNKPQFNNVASNSVQYEMKAVPGTGGGGTGGEEVAMPQSTQPGADTNSVIPKTETMEDQYGMEGKGITKGHSIYQ